jgi:predicted  nucleic acid-binding Zn-ribbon protein
LQKQLGVLRELQEIDEQLNQFGDKRQKLEGAVTGQRQELARVQEMVDGLADEMEALQGRRRELTEAMAREQVNVDRSDARLPEIKTQKEYVAVLKEIDTAKVMMRDLQAQASALDEQLSLIGADRTEKEEELAALTEAVTTKQAAVDTELAAFSTKVNKMTSQKEALLGQIPSGVRKRYQMLISRRAGVAVVEARKGACTGCNMQLPPQLYNSLFKLEKIQYCPLCNRLLYVLPEEA